MEKALCHNNFANDLKEFPGAVAHRPQFGRARRIVRRPRLDKVIFLSQQAL
jgi:hypothetical protein